VLSFVSKPKFALCEPRCVSGRALIPQRFGAMPGALRPTAHVLGQSLMRGILLLSSLVALSGCNPDWPEHAGTAEVHGEVTLDGIPVGQAKVVFVPVKFRNVGDKIMPMAYGKTDAEGKFQLEYSDQGTDLIAGTYTVIISKFEEEKELTGNVVGDWQNQLLPDSISSLAAFRDEGETIPSIYNRNSILNYEIRASPSIVRPKFELKSIDPALEEMPLEDMPLK
jgi:hypothetical protein